MQTIFRTEMTIEMAGKKTKEKTFSKDSLMQGKRPIGQIIAIAPRRSLKTLGKNH